MMLLWGVTLLLLLLLLGGGAEAQSGDRDVEPRIICLSHISTEKNNLTCHLLGGLDEEEDDEDDEDDGIERMTLCYTDMSEDPPDRNVCHRGQGNTMTFKATPVVNYNLTAELKRGGRVMTSVNIRRIVKPRPPRVWNITFSPELHHAIIQIQSPYHNDYLKVENQLFQLHIWTTGPRDVTIQNISSMDTMMIDMEHLQSNTLYFIRVRAIPDKYIRGSWSEWSETFNFYTPRVGNIQKAPPDRQDMMYGLILCLVPIVVVTFGVVLFWKNKIFTYMWPNIPHPKDTLVQICKPNKGLLLNFYPEEFSALKVCPLEKAELHPCEEPEASVRPAAAAAAADSSQSSDPCSTQSSDCRSTTSVTTEELELSALLSSSDGEDSLQSASPSPVNVLQLRGEGSGGNEPEVFGVSQQDEAYVTMSSFYQIK